MDLTQYKEKFADNEDFTSALTAIESEFTTLSAKKETAVENEIKLRQTKQEIAKTLGFEENIPASELTAKIGETLNGYKTKIDSFEKNASSKDIENASVKEQLSTLTNQLNELTGQLTDEKATNQLNNLKDGFRKALADSRITDPQAQDIAINAHLAQAQNVDDLGAFAQSIAESNPFLTQSVHKSGAGTKQAAYVAPKTNLNDCKTPQERAAYFQNKIDVK